MAETDTSFDSVVTDLEKKREVIQAELDGLDAKRDELTGMLTRIDGALKSLSGKAPASSVPAPKGAKKRAAAKPAPTKQDVATAIASIKEQNPGIEEQDLRGLVEEHLVEKGFSRNGLSLRFKEVVAAAQS